MKAVMTFLFCLALLAVFGNEVYGYEILKGEKKGPRIEPDEVMFVNARVYTASQKHGTHTFEGYITFKNSNNETCTVSSLAKFYLWVGEGYGEPNPLKKQQYSYYKEITLTPNKFKVLKLRNGKIITAIPLKPFKVQYEYNKDRWGGLKESGTPPFRYYWEPEIGSRKFNLKFRPGGYKH